MACTEQFKEVITSPRSLIIKWILILNLGLTILIPIVLYQFMSGFTEREFAGWGEMMKNYFLHLPLPILLPMWLVLGAGLWFGYRITVEVREDVLYLPAESRYKARHFALTDIAACRERRYEYKLLSQLSPGREAGGIIEQVVMLPGYVGPGVEIVFLRARKNIFNLTQMVFKDGHLEGYMATGNVEFAGVLQALIKDKATWKDILANKYSRLIPVVAVHA